MANIQDKNNGATNNIKYKIFEGNTAFIDSWHRFCTLRQRGTKM